MKSHLAVEARGCIGKPADETAVEIVSPVVACNFDKEAVVHQRLDSSVGMCLLKW